VTENVVVLGATSGIARPLCHILAQHGCRLILAGRKRDELDKIAADLHIRFQIEVFVEPFDALDLAGHNAFVDRCLQHFNGVIEGVVLCYGYMPEQAKTQMDFAEARRTIDVNFTSVVSILNLMANHLEQRKCGYIAAISSIAGDRGRQSNYTYGAAKAALSAYLQGLRNRLYRAGVHVLTIKPGFVDTSMTHGLLDSNSSLMASPNRVAQDIYRAIQKRKSVVYTPWFWAVIMLIVRAIPEAIFKRLML
jgi:short-subunit dehydrogenase